MCIYLQKTYRRKYLHLVVTQPQGVEGVSRAMHYLRLQSQFRTETPWERMSWTGRGGPCSL